MKNLCFFCLLVSLPLAAQSNAIIFADQFPTSTYQDIITNNSICPPNGCTIYATSPTPSQLSLGFIDPGSKVVTIYLGPFGYTVDHIILRKGLRIIGMGASDAGTILKSVNTANFPIFSLPQAINTPATDVYLYGLRMLGATSNTSQSAIWLDCSSLSNAGLWHSTFEDLNFIGFLGSAIGLFGPINNVAAANQFLSFRNIWASRPPVGGPDLRIEGANGQIDCIECHLDGWGVGAPPTPPSTIDGWSNVFIGNLSGGVQTPYSIHFLNMTSQGANNAVQIQGGVHISFIGSHFEALNGAYQLNAGTGLQVRDIWMAHDHFNGNVGIDVNNHGNGFILFAQNASDVVIEAESLDGTPDRFLAGNTAGNVSVLNSFSFQTGPIPSKIVGSLSVTGTISKGGGSFKIDHPLDPDNKYLSHSFVESPDMKNIYDGIAVLDSKGEAEVVLPDWFQALNQDFRYQLSCIGKSAPVYIAQEVRNNRFKIAGGRRGLRVSWQVTGIRHDAFANANRIRVEEEKRPADQDRR